MENIVKIIKNKEGIMGERRSNGYDKRNSNKESEEVVKMVTIQIPKDVSSNTEKKITKNPKKKRGALEISNSIGVHGAFGHTLSDLHKQGR